MQKKLFEDINLNTDNLLPYDGKVSYYGILLDSETANFFYRNLMENIAWKNDELKMFGKRIITKRKVAWYGDEALQYTYSNIRKTASVWNKELTELKNIVEEECGESFNSCLLNLYHNGNEAMGWHSDDEKELKKNGAIASVSLGAPRDFIFKHKISKEKVKIKLENGSLLVMKGETQRHWLHQLPKRTKISAPRINLTFRTIVV